MSDNQQEQNTPPTPPEQSNEATPPPHSPSQTPPPAPMGSMNQTPPPPNYTGQPIPGADKKILAGLLGIFLGAFGIHKFVLGYQKEGIIMLVITVATCGLGSMVTSIIGLIEGIMYITKTDEEFVQTYITNQKPWF